MIDAPPCTGLNDIHDYVLEDDVPVIMDTEELFEEQDSKIMLFSPIEDSLQVWKHHGINLMVSIAGSYVDSNSL
jgi:hypothetical protein